MRLELCQRFHTGANAGGPFRFRLELTALSVAHRMCLDGIVLSMPRLRLQVPCDGPVWRSFIPLQGDP